jgi:metal-responsive CopG/Arc/MetJ family transcriptional regulator
MVTDARQRRAHIVMPTELVEEIDAQVGPRRRSRFVQEAVEEKLRRQRLQTSLAEMAGSLADVDIPGWETQESAAEWVRALRRGDPVGVSTIAVS